jgi:hypothetical protein
MGRRPTFSGCPGQGLDAEGDGAESGGVHLLEQLVVEAIEPGLAFPVKLELAGANLVTKGEDPLAVLAEEGIRKTTKGSG